MREFSQQNPANPRLKDRCLQVLVGLPRSGKSTWATHQAIDTPVVNPDSIRKFLGAFPFVSHMEPLVWWVARVMVESLFEAGNPVVILDATNITDERRREWKSPKWATVYHVFPTPITECIRRAEENGDAHLVPIIESMAAKGSFPTESDGKVFWHNETAEQVQHVQPVPVTAPSKVQ